MYEPAVEAQGAKAWRVPDQLNLVATLGVLLDHPGLLHIPGSYALPTPMQAQKAEISFPLRPSISPP